MGQKAMFESLLAVTVSKHESRISHEPAVLYLFIPHNIFNQNQNNRKAPHMCNEFIITTVTINRNGVQMTTAMIYKEDST